jgi:phosphoserine phosphatase
MHASREDRRASFQAQIVSMARRLGRSLDLREVLEQVVDTGRDVLDADRASVLLLDQVNNELYSKATSAREEIRFPADQGIAGETLAGRRLIRIDDCYADPRFNQEVDQATGYRTYCMVSVPLIGVDEAVIGVMQLLNAARGRFTEEDERLAEMFAVFAALAVQRAAAYEDRVRKVKMETDLDLARQLQVKLLPATVPPCVGYEIAVFSRQAEETGGDIYDLFPPRPSDADSLMVLLADATGHGIAAAVSVTQLRAMLRIAARLDVGLGATCEHLNNQLVEDLPTNRFITGFVGLLEARHHTIDYRSLGQAPLLHYQAANRRCEWLAASSPPMGLIPTSSLKRPEPIRLKPGDIFVLLSDGFYEYANPDGEMLGDERVGAVIDDHRHAAAGDILSELCRTLERFARGAAQEDDLTAILIKRSA